MGLREAQAFWDFHKFPGGSDVWGPRKHFLRNCVELDHEILEKML